MRIKSSQSKPLLVDRKWPSICAEEAHHVPTLEQHFRCPHQQWQGDAYRRQGQKCWNGFGDHGGTQGAGGEVQKEQWEDGDMGEHCYLLLQDVMGRCCGLGECLVSVPGCDSNKQGSRNWLWSEEQWLKSNWAWPEGKNPMHIRKRKSMAHLYYLLLLR